MITAPYNFIPLNKEVFYPSWGEQVSHDIPFEDGESGEVEITITAKSPIFIRDHANQEQFCQHNGEYYIPSSSVKGMVRNVLEILSFSKLRLQDKTLSYRDLNHPSYKAKAMDTNKIYMGWLLRDGQKWSIQNLGKVTEGNTRIKYTDMAKYFDKQQVEAIKKQRATAFDKYKAIGGYIREIDNGFIVFTGSTGNKTREFLFPRAEPIKIYSFSENDKLINTFKEAYYIGTPNESKDWKNMWSKHFRQGKKVPIFFQLDDGGDIKHFGLSMLYKLPYTHSIKDGIPKSHFASEDLDLAQTIFGYISKNNKEALKGRVQFSHFKAPSNIKALTKRTEILGTPRASYYPTYIKQTDGKLFATFMDSYFEIAGRKRYPIHNSNQVTKTEDTENENVGITFAPLKDGVVFKGKMRFHNLKKAEIGALLSALTFHNTPRTFHNIGLAKSLGYGKVELRLNGINDMDGYLKAFELAIGEQISNWIESPQLAELFAMATEQKNEGTSKLKYMSLLEFAKNKTGANKDYLRNYTALNNIVTINIKSFLSVDEKKRLKSNRENILIQREEKIKQEVEIKKQKELQEAKTKKEQEDLEKALNTDNLQTIENFINSYPENVKTEELKAKLHMLQEAQKQNKFAEVNKTAKEQLDKTLAQPDKKKRKDFLEKFIDKWSKEKENKGSEDVLELVKKAKEELK